jgi:cytochrome c
MSVEKLRSAPEIGLGICGAVLAVSFATAQISPPPAKPPDGAALFKQQCGTCHTTNLSDPPRQGPSLFKVMGRQAGKLDGFHYSAGFAEANFAWDEEKLDAWLTNPQAVVPSAVMVYRQPKPETRAAIITYLRELN